MADRTWNTSLDGQPLVVRAVVDPRSAQLVVYVDGFPAHREAVQQPIRPHHRAELTIGGHPAAIFAVPTHGGRLHLQLALDGVCVETGRPQAQLGHPKGDPGNVPQGSPAYSGDVPFDAEHYYRHHLRWPLVSSITTGIGGVLAGAVAWQAFQQPDGVTQATAGVMLICLTLVATGGLWWWQDLSHLRNIFAFAELRPAKRLSERPVRLATAVNLALPGHRPAWAVRVSTHADSAVQHVPGGQAVPVVVFRLPSQDGMTNPNVAVHAVGEGTPDPQVQRQLYARLSAEDLAQLDKLTAGLDASTPDGLYRDKVEDTPPAS